ncbi:MAG: hypothetical protein JOZ75_11195 [Candidatus Dormibacteraeota bacterium]|nr:hypothetical protein [Candidatus Dormibacteraeota bacterium]
MHVTHLLVVAGVVLGINILPAFAPPTWTVLVYFRITDGLAIAPLVLVGAVSAAVGRYVLAIAFRAFGGRLPRRRRENLEAVGATLSSQHGLLATVLLFAVSPLPSNTLFEAAGLAHVRLAPLVSAFFVGRVASYAFYLTVTTSVAGGIRGILSKGFASPQAIAIGVLGLIALIAFVRIDWIDVIDRARAWLARRRGRPAPPSIRLTVGQEGQRQEP